MPEPITPREAALRTAAVAALCGLAIVQLLALPYALVQGSQIAAISGPAIAGGLRGARARPAAGAREGREAGRGRIAVRAGGGRGWLGTRRVRGPRGAEGPGNWPSAIGLAGA